MKPSDVIGSKVPGWDLVLSHEGINNRMSKILSVATAGLYADQLEDIDHHRFPRVDYIELQRLLDTETLNYSAYNKEGFGEIFRYLETQLRSDMYLATLGWLKSRNHPVVFTWSERAGIPFAIYKRYLRSEHRFVTMFQCWSERQEFVIKNLGLLGAMDNIIVHCASMKQKMLELGATEAQVKLIQYSVDQSFFSPQPGLEPVENRIMSIGEPRSRDYGSLFQAIQGLPVNLEIAAYGHWYAREKSSSLKINIPQNVSLKGHLSQVELRQLYASAQFVVLPIHDLVYSAGATVSLEAAGMARAVIAFRSRGIVDYIIHGETGILVEPGDITALRDAIQFLLANPAEAKRLGQNARQRIVEKLNLENYVNNIANLLVQNDL